MRNCTVNITAGTILKTVVILASAYLAWVLRDLVLMFFASIVIAAAISPTSNFLAKAVPKPVAVLVVYFAFFASFFAVMYFFVPTVIQQTGQLLINLPELVDKLDGNSTDLQFIDTKSLVQAVNHLNEMFAKFKSDHLGVITMVFGGVLSFVMVVVLSFYFAINEKGVEDFIRTITPIDKEETVIRIWESAQKKMGLWLQGQLLLAVLIGVMVFLGLSILGVPHALVLAVFAAFMELIPIFGPILAAIPAIMMAILNGGLALALAVLVFYVIVQQLENNFIYPLVVTKVVGVAPVLVILALIAGAKLSGLMGALLAVPFVVILQEIFEELDKRRKRELKKRSQN